MSRLIRIEFPGVANIANQFGNGKSFMKDYEGNI